MKYSAFTVATNTMTQYVTFLYYLDCSFQSCHGGYFYFLVTVKFGVSYFRLNFVSKEKKRSISFSVVEEWIKNLVSLLVLLCVLANTYFLCNVYAIVHFPCFLFPYLMLHSQDYRFLLVGHNAWIKQGRFMSF